MIYSTALYKRLISLIIQFNNQHEDANHVYTEKTTEVNKVK